MNNPDSHRDSDVPNSNNSFNRPQSAEGEDLEMKEFLNRISGRVIQMPPVDGERDDHYGDDSLGGHAPQDEGRLGDEDYSLAEDAANEALSVSYVLIGTGEYVNARGEKSRIAVLVPLDTLRDEDECIGYVAPWDVTVDIQGNQRIARPRHAIQIDLEILKSILDSLGLNIPENVEAIPREVQEQIYLETMKSFENIRMLLSGDDKKANNSDNSNFTSDVYHFVNLVHLKASGTLYRLLSEHIADDGKFRGHEWPFIKSPPPLPPLPPLCNE